MFRKILIANRGEIACRVAHSARRLGVETVAVYSDADAQAKHVAACDEAVRLGPAAARESYLVGASILRAAQATGAEAIHPGYGFLSENAEFAAACEKAGVVFIGPPAKSIHAMGSKSAAKTLMQSAGVPLVPGYHGDDQDPALLASEAQAIGFPVLIKASAGGGGKGMRIVRNASEFAQSLSSCKREALASFGDDKVLVEKYLQRPRHIEIQIFADSHGNCVYLFERDCSVQRRHQKVLEEAPAPGMTEQRRSSMGAAAVAAAHVVAYVGAGTVEFIVDHDGTFYFMEMNTRLQVEHPVTEMITGFDLVEWQLRIACGEALPCRQEDLKFEGHALEARLYAENPDRGFLPSTGTLRRLHLPAASEFVVHDGARRASVRIDSGVREGDTISPYYDPMIAKLIVWGEDRATVLARMHAALAGVQIIGVSNNIEFLGRVVASSAFATADLDTGLIERHHDELLPKHGVPEPQVIALAVAAQVLNERSRRGSDPWDSIEAFRLHLPASRRFEFEDGGIEVFAQLDYQPGGKLRLTVGEHGAELAITAGPEASINILWGEERVAGDVVLEAEALHVFHRARYRILTVIDRLQHTADADARAGGLTAPMPGKIVAINAPAGTRVARGAALLVMEAMKMEHTIAAPADGLVTEVLFAVGDQVSEGAQLLQFTEDAAASP